MFVHGAGGNRLLWGSVMASLAPSQACVAIDLPGHGRSDGPGLGSVSAYAENCAGFVTKLGLGPAILAGHSMGGGVAMSMALTRPELVRALVLVSTGARLRVAPGILEGLKSDFEGSAGAFAAYACGSDAPTRVTNVCLKGLLSAGPATLGGDLEACDRFDVRAELGSIRSATLVICGDNDLLTPLKYSQYLASGIAGASLTVVRGAGHMVMLQAPHTVAESIAAFLSELP